MPNMGAHASKTMTFVGEGAPFEVPFALFTPMLCALQRCLQEVPAMAHVAEVPFAPTFREHPGLGPRRMHFYTGS